MKLHDFLDWHAREAPERLCATDGTSERTYAQVQQEAQRAANGLVAAGLAVGDRYALLAKNCLEYTPLYFAGSMAGTPVVPLNYRLAPPELAYIIKDAGAKLVIARGELCEAIDAVRDDLPEVKTFIAIGGAREGWVDYGAWLAEQPAGPPPVEVGYDDAVYQMYTSGTTGHPKGAVITHRAAVEHLMQQMPAFGATADDRVLVVAPQYHAAGGITAIGAVAFGSSMVVHEDFDPGAVVRELSEGGITRTTLVPAMIQACLVLVPDVAERSYDTLRLMVYGASPIAADTLARAMQVFQCGFIQAYGMTETTAVLTLLSEDDHRRAVAGEEKLLLSAGRALLGTEVAVVGADDRPLPAGDIGEVCGRGPQLMQGYWNLPDATRSALKGGWMHTGDAGILDADGYLYIQDRVKDMVVSGGENVYPREVENALFEHPTVADAAVIGVPDEKFGEAVKAIVVLREGQSATADEIMDFCKGRLGGYKRPRSVDFIDELPRNASGKVLKKDLREPYWKDRDRRVG